MNRSIDNKSYELVQDGPEAMSWSEYESIANAEWRALLDSDAAADERQVQGFLEQNPCFVPGYAGPTGSAEPYLPALVTQPRLQGLTVRQPDFMWLTRDSMSLYPTLIEIEAPTKRWFREDSNQRAELTQAIEQLHEWSTWINTSANKQLFLDFYEVPADDRTRLHFRPRYFLIYGRRAEFEGRPDLNAKRASRQPADAEFMTFDRLRPDLNASSVLTVRKTDRKYRAQHIQPTFKLAVPPMAPAFERIGDREEAIQRNRRISPERKQFLVERFAYWDNWLGSGNWDGVMQTGQE